MKALYISLTVLILIAIAAGAVYVFRGYIKRKVKKEIDKARAEFSGVKDKAQKLGQEVKGKIDSINKEG